MKAAGKGTTTARGWPNADRSRLQSELRVPLQPAQRPFRVLVSRTRQLRKHAFFLTALGSLTSVRSRAGGAGLGPSLAPHRLLAAPHAVLVWPRLRRGQDDRACAPRRRVPRVRECARAPALPSAALQVRIVFGSSSFQIPFSFRERLSEGGNLGDLIFFQLRDKRYKDDYDTGLCPRVCIDSRGGS